MELYKIVLTGGPCSGKTKVMNGLIKRLEKDYYVITVPETAAELIRANINPNEDYNHTIKFQDIVLKRQNLKEKQAEEYAKILKETKPIIILYDRAILDGYAYMPTKKDFDRMLDNNSIKELNLVDSYDMVIDLVSLATLKKDLYENDDVRKEDDNLASVLDKKTLSSWLLSDNLKIVKPFNTVEEKIEYVYKLITDLIEIKQEDKTRKVNIKLDSINEKLYTEENSRKIDVTKYILDTPLKESLDYFICERKYNDSVSYLLKRTIKNSFGNDIELKNSNINRDVFKHLIESFIVLDIDKKTEIKFIDEDYDLFKLSYNDNNADLKIYSDDYKIPCNLKVLK